MNAVAPASLLAPPLRHPEHLPAVPAGNSSVVAQAFRPVPRPTKICGKIAEFDLGGRIIYFPTSYACEDKDEEYRNAPAAGKDIDDPESPGYK